MLSFLPLAISNAFFSSCSVCIYARVIFDVYRKIDYAFKFLLLFIQIHKHTHTEARVQTYQIQGIEFHLAKHVFWGLLRKQLQSLFRCISFSLCIRFSMQQLFDIVHFQLVFHSFYSTFRFIIIYVKLERFLFQPLEPLQHIKCQTKLGIMKI